MSGGTFDYMQYRLDDAVEEIDRRLAKNNKSIQEYWNSLSNEERSNLYDYERPYSFNNFSQIPHWLLNQAEMEADREIGEKAKNFDCLTIAEKKKWNDIRQRALIRLIEEHNNSPIGTTYSDKTVAKIREMVKTIKLARIYLQRIDWLMAGDDGEESFFERTEEELEELEKEYKDA